MRKLLIAVFVLFLSVQHSFAQNQLELSVASAPSANTGITQGPVTATFLRNTTLNTNSFAAYNPSLTVSFQVANNQFTQSTLATGVPVNIGATGPRIDNLNFIDAPLNADYSTDQFNIGAGISTSFNYGCHMNTHVAALTTAGVSRSARPYMADLIITFNRPVNNPIIHVAGLGAFVGSAGYATELELQTPNITLSMLSGNTNLSVSNNKILNNRAVPSSGTGAAGGSILAMGTGITTMMFKLYVHGDGAANSNWGTGNFGFDGWCIGFTLAPVQSLSGNLFNDANGLNNNTVDGIGTNISNTIYANLVDGQNKIVATTALAADGSFGFPEVFTGPQTVQISTTAGTLSSTAPAPALPAGWVNTGEYIGSGPGNDGVVDGINAVTITTSPINNVNFGADRLPIATNIFAAIETPNQDSYLTLNDMHGVGTPGPLAGSDAEDQPMEGLLANKTVAITSLPDKGELYYNGVIINFGDDSINPPSVTNPKTIVSYTPDLLQVKFTEAGYLTTSFQYSYIDAASKISPPATYTITWILLLPVKLIHFEGSNIGCKTTLSWQTAAATNMNRFELQESQNGIDFKTISYLLFNHNAFDNKYSFVYSPGSNLNYYRLKILQDDGAYTFSNVIEVKSFCQAETVVVYPNPVTSKLFVRLNSIGNHICIYKADGELVERSLQASTQSEINMSKLPSGIYQLVVEDKNQQKVKTFSIVKQ